MNSAGFFESLVSLEQNPHLHCARLLVLLGAFAGNETGEIEGITKLAKLDFLLRYPAMLERALIKRQHSTKSVAIESHERESVESKMVRYRYGPWDHRYAEFLATLQAKGLVQLRRVNQTRHIGLTSKGLAVAASLSNDDLFKKDAIRAGVIQKEFKMNASNLVRFIYDTFPELGSMQLNQSI